MKSFDSEVKHTTVNSISTGKNLPFLFMTDMELDPLQISHVICMHIYLLKTSICTRNYSIKQGSIIFVQAYKQQETQGI